jgi:hypothetical protein
VETTKWVIKEKYVDAGIIKECMDIIMDVAGAIVKCFIENKKAKNEVFRSHN